VGLTTTVRLPRRTPMNDGSGPIRTPIRILAAVFGVVFPVGGVLLFPTGIAGSLASGWRSFKESSRCFWAFCSWWPPRLEGARLGPT